MSRFRKLSQSIWHCQYHIVWVPKYRFRILTGKVAEEVSNCIRAFSEQLGWGIIELSVQLDHVHLLVSDSRRWGQLNFASSGGKAISSPSRG
jgi:putative transposase